MIRDKAYKVVDNNSDYEEHEISDDEEDLNNNQSLLSNYKSSDNDVANPSSRLFDCLTLRRNYKRNRKKPFHKKGQFKLIIILASEREFDFIHILSYYHDLI